MSRLNPFSKASMETRVVWDDLIQPVMGKNIDNSTGKLDPDWSWKGVKIADSTTISNDLHKLHWGYQLFHRVKLDGLCHPHVHWVQTAENQVPNWWVAFRFWRNGDAPEAYKYQALDQQAFPWNGGPIMLQISYNASMIDFVTEASGTPFNVSDFLDIELTRDIANDSGLFSGTDPITGNVTVKGFDPHIQIDSAGSREELAK